LNWEGQRVAVPKIKAGRQHAVPPKLKICYAPAVTVKTWRPL